MAVVTMPFELIPSKNGGILENGKMWIGEPNLNPAFNPIDVYIDDGLSIALSQPIKVLNGYASQGNTPINIHVNEQEYSIYVEDEKGNLIFSVPKVPAKVVLEDLTSINQSVANFIADVGNNDNVDKGDRLVGVKRTAIGAFATNLHDWIEAQYFNLVSDFGVAINGTDNVTNKIQLAIDSLPDYSILDGMGKLYTVTNLYLKSNIELRNFRFITMAGNEDFTSPINVDGTITEKNNIRLRDVYINGNRANQTNIDTPTEDGSRHGFRFIGKCKNILLENVEANYCGSDGIIFFTSGVNSYNCFENIKVRNGRFQWNRRHGGSMDSANNILFDNCNFDYNGRDLNTSDVLNHGNRGARSVGNTYGNGFDYETYNIYGSGSNIYFINCSGVDNCKAGLLFLENTPANLTGFDVSRNINIIGGIYNAGINTALQGGEGASISFTPQASNINSGTAFREIKISGITAVGNITMSTCASSVIGDDCIIFGDTIIPDYIALLLHSFGIHVGCAGVGKVFTDGIGTHTRGAYETANLNAPSLATGTGATTLVISSNTMIDYDGKGYSTWLIKGTFTSATTSQLNLSVPTGQTIIDCKASMYTIFAGAYGDYALNNYISVGQKIYVHTAGNLGFEIIVKQRINEL